MALFTSKPHCKDPDPSRFGWLVHSFAEKRCTSIPIGWVFKVSTKLESELEQKEKVCKVDFG
jgi:hypothetical protein